ncbi:MAG TPA: 3-deoxy-8-phosphooctulonate synthase [Candidatus Coprenecus stercoravium]|uniref:3-deoxy-8-phosphooctulonate synthase n=1 Tax=Candidatus Coprenecus stercoravium TaxID=2840735 RepID=A0A9D2KAJ4_9BACT|nr:3-deoxy-8-phosphooctulonate synthase [Candidatus Coprenecus stercoravium]
MITFKAPNFTLLAGPCVIEGEEITRSIADTLCSLTSKYEIPFIFKASYRKANRSRYDSFTGIGDEKGLEILARIREDFKVPVVTDVHLPAEAATAASYGIDMLQIPAFLCRQTDLLEAAARTGKWVNIKKGQFLSPESMRFAAEKVAHAGNNNITLTERGTQFGYSDLIIDFRGIPTMKATGYPVIVDVTHSLQAPNQSSGVTGGHPEMISTMARAAIATGADALFMETHPDPSKALSDGANMLRLSKMEDLLRQLLPIRQAVRNL